jgi:hypothetical protein
MIWKLDHGLPPIRLSADEPRVSPTFLTIRVEAWLNGLGRSIEATCDWSTSLTRFGVARCRAAVRAMLKQYEGAQIQLATQRRITSLASALKQGRLIGSLNDLECRLSPGTGAADRRPSFRKFATGKKGLVKAAG